MGMQDVLGLILGGGKGTRLAPLTRDRSKPAVPLAGKYRLIDIPMSNCFHAGIDKIAILTQFNSVSLHRHIYRTYNRDVFATGWVQILAAEQTAQSADWYQGTADAVRKQWIEIQSAGTEYILILAGDHLYRMDYADFTRFHIESGADVSVAVQPVATAAAPALGILTLNDAHQIVRFTEKPTLDQLPGLESNDDPERPYMGSMGIYLFRREVLRDLLDREGVDFGKEIIPNAIDSHRIMGYAFDGYWEDIGTIRRFFEVNLELAQPYAPFDLYSPERPIYTHPRFLPGSEIHGAHMHNVLLADGCRLYDCEVDEAIIGLRSIIGSNVKLNRVVMMGADYFETGDDMAQVIRDGIPPIGIGEGSVIEEAILDKNARIGQNVQIRKLPDRPDAEFENWAFVDGIVVIPKNAIVPDGTVL